MDIDLKGGKFTWFSSPRNRLIIKERIYRALVNWKWRHKFPNASLIAMPTVSSDHTPIVLRLHLKYKADKSFKFEAFWIDHKECEEIIKMSWKKKEHSNNEWGRLLKKMRNCKKNLRNWSRNIFARADIEINKSKVELQKLQEANLNEKQQVRKCQIKEKISQLWRQEEKYWGMRSRLKWLKWGDKNSSFFHATTIQRRNRNKVERLKDKEGQWVSGKDRILNIVEEHFTKLFTSSVKSDFRDCINRISKRVTQDMNEQLIEKISEKEIEEALFSMGSLKVPGPDNLNGLFYQSH
ncbi:hypothetical protein Ahy_Scaffold1g106806 [Arachis hypogaea]|uniref:Reverse transcriptase n=1 Tax=Arachis hypogaea TaxID=3818 RepID=A0A444WSA8_ARAHY|nr:hypothetical protein Ahy_Scaffold1g106806 [Arachis hypogaea]